MGLALNKGNPFLQRKLHPVLEMFPTSRENRKTASVFVLRGPALIGTLLFQSNFINKPQNDKTGGRGLMQSRCSQGSSNPLENWREQGIERNGYINNTGARTTK
jgi:hypothetical protein